MSTVVLRKFASPSTATCLVGHIGTIEPAWHMNKRYWNMVDFEAPDADEKLMRHLIAHSYNEVLKKMPRSQREGLQMLRDGKFELK